jgi:non-canonical purine NTP pyrophosphatase (RdgB/HAM1 family)
MPGVRSARFAGRNADDAANRRALIELLSRRREREFPARFRCVMVLASQGELLGSFEGVVEGKVIPEECGSEGFGYDCMFVPHGYSETFGELQPEIKNSLSHRRRALAKVLEFLRS